MLQGGIGWCDIEFEALYGFVCCLLVIKGALGFASAAMQQQKRKQYGREDFHRLFSVWIFVAVRKR